jgi:hypothetical protein
MILLALSVAIPGDHTRLTHLETSAPLLAALGTAVGRRIAMIVRVHVFWSSAREESLPAKTKRTTNLLRKMV